MFQTGRPRARNGENKSAKIQKMLIFRPYPRYKQTEDRPAQRTPLLTQEICIPWGLTLRAAPPHSNDTFGLPKRDFRSPAAIQDPMPRARFEHVQVVSCGASWPSQSLGVEGEVQPRPRHDDCAVE